MKVVSTWLCFMMFNVESFSNVVVYRDVEDSMEGLSEYCGWYYALDFGDKWCICSRKDMGKAFTFMTLARRDQSAGCADPFYRNRFKLGLVGRVEPVVIIDKPTTHIELKYDTCTSIKNISTWNYDVSDNKGRWEQLPHSVTSFFTLSSRIVSVNNLDLSKWLGHLLKLDFHSCNKNFFLYFKIKGSIEYPFDMATFVKGLQQKNLASSPQKKGQSLIAAVIVVVIILVLLSITVIFIYVRRKYNKGKEMNEMTENDKCRTNTNPNSRDISTTDLSTVQGRSGGTKLKKKVAFEDKNKVYAEVDNMGDQCCEYLEPVDSIGCPPVIYDEPLNVNCNPRISSTGDIHQRNTEKSLPLYFELAREDREPSRLIEDGNNIFVKFPSSNDGQRTTSSSGYAEVEGGSDLIKRESSLKHDF